ncbi:hypothetical protein [Salipiger sp. CCB-MM3]|uniref:hypothetical protein n=1 Tax=Salipiger sp. CCB-MM3 TaxID=1792508 RepID=UPI0012F963C1|nr:hypothetical protein [Salipiger sp. CCB-MM3]
MKHSKIDEREKAFKRDRVIRTAEWVLAQAYRHAYRGEIIASQLRIQKDIVREMGRRAK